MVAARCEAEPAIFEGDIFDCSKNRLYLYYTRGCKAVDSNIL
jgi:hypothetical protein